MSGSNTYETIAVETPETHIMQLRLQRPKAMNALNTRMGEEVRDFFRHFDHFQSPDIRCLILTGSGPKAFCAGGDLKERRGMTDTEWRYQHAIFEDMCEAIWRFPSPIIAAVNGVAMGGGLEMALACDFMIAAQNARFAQPEVKLGIIPGVGGTQRLPRRIGPARAKELLMTGRAIDANQAERWGLANCVTSPENLLTTCMEIARQIAANGPIAVRQAKKSVERGMGLALADALEFELQAYNQTIPTQDRQEGVNAFNEKRNPVFKNC